MEPRELVRAVPSANRQHIPERASCIGGILCSFCEWDEMGLFIRSTRSLCYGSAPALTKLEDQVRSALLINSSYTVQANAELIAFLLIRSATPSNSDRTPSSPTILRQAWYMFR